MKVATAPERTADIRVKVSENYEAICTLGAEHFVQTVQTAVAARGRAVVALSGGSTPRGMYSLLATEPYRIRVPWDNLHVLWGDERSVPPDNEQSNYRMARESLLSHVPIPAVNVHRLRGESSSLSEAAEQYEHEIRELFNDPNGVPGIDLIHLGMGDDGHTASLFPGSTALYEGHALVVANHVEKLKTERLTFTYRLINAAATVVFLVSGDAKASPVQQVLEGPYDPLNYPSQGIQPSTGSLVWLLDRSAAASLSPTTLTRRTTGQRS